MKIVNQRIECLQGEKFSQLMSGFDFTAATQVVVLLYPRESIVGSGFSKAFVKVVDTTKYPDATFITLNSDGKMVLPIDTTGMIVGDYDVEVRVDLGSTSIVKERTFFLTVKESRT